MTADQIQSLYNQINAYILGHFEMFWTIIIGVFAIIGIALYFVVKSIIAKGIKDEAEKQHQKYADLENRVDQIKAASLRYHPDEYDLPLAVGVESTAEHSCRYSKSCDGLIVLIFSIKAADGDLPSGTHQIAVLPYGYKSSKEIENTLSHSLSVFINKDGFIYYTSDRPLKKLSCASLSFYAG